MVPRQLLWMPSSKSLWYSGEAPSWSWAAYTGQVEIWDAQADFWDAPGWFPEVHLQTGEIIKIPLHGWPRPFDCNERSYAVLSDPRAGPDQSQNFKVGCDLTLTLTSLRCFCILPIVKKIRLVRAKRKHDRQRRPPMLFGDS